MLRAKMKCNLCPKLLCLTVLKIITQKDFCAATHYNLRTWTNSDHNLYCRAVHKSARPSRISQRLGEEKACYT